VDDRVEVASRTAWRAWLAEHHSRAAGVWVVTWKKGSGGPHVPYSDLVEEALCFGWIDSRPGKVDERRSRVWLAPRKRGSGWSRANKERVERLAAAGLVAERGLGVIEAAKADGSWTALDAVEELVVADDLASALAEHQPAREQWDAFSRSTRKGILQWIASAKKPATRAARVLETALLAQQGTKANQWVRKT
jgi:uncharacterized protein YdeI (YjbR/CyaY-like superfamily)